MIVKALHFDCSSGVSSDMLLGALLHLGADADEVASALRGVGLGAFRLRVGEVERRGVTGYAAAVEVTGDPAGGRPGFAQPRDHRTHDHGHDHQTDDHGHGGHSHVSPRDVATLINGADIGSAAKSYALAAYAALAEAEAAAHGVTTNEVHFHEVGSPRAIYTVTGVAIAAELLGVTDFSCGELRDGSGVIECSHGTIPVPVPAVRELLKRTDLPLVSDPDIGTELVTPTGLALLIGLGCRYVRDGGAPGQVRNVGYGFGTRDSGLLGAVRALLIQP